MSGPTLDPLFDYLISPTGILPSASELSSPLRLSKPQVMSVLNPDSKLSVWPLSRSLAATRKIDVSFSSSGYLDVSVPRVPFIHLWIQCMMTGVLPAGFPHSDIRGSMDICSSPRLFAAYHVLLRLLVPRHPPYALLRLIFVVLFFLEFVLPLEIVLRVPLLSQLLVERSPQLFAASL